VLKFIRIATFGCPTDSQPKRRIRAVSIRKYEFPTLTQWKYLGAGKSAKTGRIVSIQSGENPGLQIAIGKALPKPGNKENGERGNATAPSFHAERFLVQCHRDICVLKLDTGQQHGRPGDPLKRNRCQVLQLVDNIGLQSQGLCPTGQRRAGDFSQIDTINIANLIKYVSIEVFSFHVFIST
jgi:hypothetical protein